MFHYAGIRLEVSRVAQAILTDVKNAKVDPMERMVIENRLYEHLTGKHPIKSSEWLNQELLEEAKKNCP